MPSSMPVVSVMMIVVEPTEPSALAPASALRSLSTTRS